MHAELSHRLTSHEKWSYGQGRIEPYLGEWDDAPVHRAGSGLLWRWLDGSWVLDLDDAATAGVLVGMLPPRSYAMRQASGDWFVCIVGSGSAHDAATLGEAAARALLALWGQP